ncbi:MAG: hypothetical protein NVS2B6_16590 [Thermoleophilaceae bacterium]
MALTIVEKASRTDVGRQRQSNEDSYLERSPLFVVADGMGGARAGEVASRLAIEAFDGDLSTGSAEERLADLARAANRRIYDLAQEDSAHAGMGTTVTAALVTGPEVAVAHVGDSRLYRLRDGQIERLTDDHSLVEEFVRSGKLTPEEAERHLQRSIITRALGPEPDVEVDTLTHAGRDGDIYLICSDGLTGMVSEAAIAEIVSHSDSLEAAAEELISGANAAGGKDNITVLLFRLGPDGESAEASDTLAGQDTDAGGVSAASVRAALAADDEPTPRAGPAASATRPRPPPAAQDTIVVGATEAAAERRDGARGRPPGGRSRRGRRVATALVLVLATGAVIVGLYAGSRQFWFVGANSRGQITLYRGLPYRILGVSLNSKVSETNVQASSIADPRRRDHIVNRQLRTHADAVDLFRQAQAAGAKHP